MMNTTGSGAGLTFLWGVHVLAVIAFFVGVFFLLFWATKTLNIGQLKNWGIGLIVVGTIACLLTIGARGAPWNEPYGMGNRNAGMMRMDMMDKMMDGMMEEEDDEGGMMQGGMGMSMNGMTMMLEGKTGDDFDKAFIQMMIPHHQGAIDMAEAALENSGHDALKNLATEIISAQQREIDMMKQWQEDWGYTE